MALTKASLCSLLLAVSTAAHADTRAYDVEPRYRQEVVSALSHIMGVEGRVAMLPTGQIVVDSSPERLEQIEAVLEAIQRQSSPETPSVSLRYWVLFATPGTQDSDPIPAILDGVVREMEAAHGDLGFAILDAFTLIGGPDRLSTLESETLEIAQRVFPNGSRLNAEIVIQNEYQELSVNAALESGEFLVLSEGTIENEAGTRGTLAFVVHWPAGD